MTSNSLSSGDSLVKHDVTSKPALEKTSSSKKLKQGVAKVVHKVTDQRARLQQSKYDHEADRLTKLLNPGVN
ncbi:hypothetical protein WJX82_007550 [Trebouxia sp. C0006]